MPRRCRWVRALVFLVRCRSRFVQHDVRLTLFVSATLSFSPSTYHHYLYALLQRTPKNAGYKIQFVILELAFLVLMIAAVPIGAHGTVLGVSIANLLALAFFWYNLVRSVDVTADGALRFWIGNIEVDVPFDKIVSIRRIGTNMPCSLCITSQPYRGFLSTPTDGVAIVTTCPGTPFWLWPRSSGRPDRTCCFGALSCPRLTVVFSPASGGLNFIREVENEMRNFSNGNSKLPTQRNFTLTSGAPRANNPDYLDV